MVTEYTLSGTTRTCNRLHMCVHMILHISDPAGSDDIDRRGRLDHEGSLLQNIPEKT